MRVLIDTHYVLWAAINSKRMEAWARKLIANLDIEILVSAASVCEISLKVRHGKLPEAVVFESAARFDDSHADPFDRMIAAQAIQNNLPVLSTDPRLDVFGVRRLKKPRR